VTQVSDARRGEISAGLAAATSRIRSAEVAASRPEGSVRLVVITKTFPAAEVGVLADLGVRHVGENRDQEAAAKAELLVDRNLVWHYVGQLQTNKVRSVVRYASVVESVDRTRLVQGLSRAAEGIRHVISCLIQVSLDDQPGRGGADPSDVPALAEAIAGSPSLTLDGLMAVAPLGGDPDEAFERLAVVAADLRRDHPDASVISAGMSGDLEAAVRHGATHVRLGSAILGSRPVVG
jgi:pyridoxal phosphate enzyme (YggS family)